MLFESYAPLFSPGISLIGLMIVIWQLHINNKQRESESLARIIEANRQRITLGFSHPELLAVLKDEKSAKQEWERFYLQLWLNEFCMAHAFIKHSFFRRERRENLTRGISDFMRMDNMQLHWEAHREYYPVSFQKFVNEIVKKIEPTQESSASAQLSST